MGPTTYAVHKDILSRLTSSAVAESRAGPPIARSTPPHDMANARTKYVSTGYVLMTLRTVAMVDPFAA